MFLWVQSIARVARECVVYILKCTCSTFSWVGEDGKESGYLQNPHKNEIVQIKSDSYISSCTAVDAKLFSFVPLLSSAENSAAWPRCPYGE